MATKVIDNNEARVPFLGDKISFITGLDPLGLQNPSTQMYSYLLPGLNNVTNAIRNYSFYCWLLSEYAKSITSTDPKLQKQFIRRAEYIIALLSVYAEIQGISGSTYATFRLNEGDEIDLEKGTYNTDGSTDKTYWQYHYGVFGQYYFGSLRQIGLIEEPVNEKGEFIGIYRRTARCEKLKISGEDLADAFESAIKKTENKSLFLTSIRNGKITKTDLVSLAEDFNLRKEGIDSAERVLLTQLLCENDEPLSSLAEPLSMRKETIVHVLKFISEGNSLDNQHAFTKYAYRTKAKDVAGQWDECMTGWYYYQLNEYWQVACTAIFNGCLDLLQEQKGPGWMSLPELIETCNEKIIAYLSEKELINTTNQSVSLSLESIALGEEELYENIRKHRQVKRMSYGFLLIWKLYQANREFFPELKQYTDNRNIGNNDDVLAYFLNVGKSAELSISQFIPLFLSARIISRHMLVAYRKMGIGSQTTQKFIIEDNYIRHTGNFDPYFTSPRIASLTTFLKDLSLITNEYQLTTHGVSLLNQFDI